MEEDRLDKGIGRRQALRRLVAGAGASAALPALGGAAADAAQTAASAHVHPPQGTPEAQSLGSTQPPDPSLTSADWKPKFFDAHQSETIVALSDLIIPDTDTPGAKAALANRFIDLLLSASDPDKQRSCLESLAWLDGYCIAEYAAPFVKLDRGQQIEVLTLLTHPSDEPPLKHGIKLFGVIKSSIVDAYYSSEIGLLQELKYDTNPFHEAFPGCPNPDEHKSS